MMTAENEYLSEVVDTWLKDRKLGLMAEVNGPVVLGRQKSLNYLQKAAMTSSVYRTCQALSLRFGLFVYIYS